MTFSDTRLSTVNRAVAKERRVVMEVMGTVEEVVTMKVVLGVLEGKMAVMERTLHLEKVDMALDSNWES